MSTQSTPPALSFLLITGAGASHNFGTGGKTVPLMADWSNYLIRKLGDTNNFYPEAVGLSYGQDGVEFERRLGNYLQAASAFPRVHQLLNPSMHFQQIDGFPFGVPMEGWFTSTQYHLGRITSIIRQSLDELFGQSQLNLDLAAQTYLELLNQMGVQSDHAFALATTNYDISADYALQKLGFNVNNGERHSVLGHGDAQLDVDHIVDGLPRSTPILHLHGKVGWYQTNSGMIALPSHYSHDENIGIPIAMLPDFEKNYESNEVINSIWRQFENLVSWAQRILVIGHSLHDQRIVDILQQNIAKPSNLAISYFKQSGATEEQRGAETTEARRLRELFPNAMIFPLDFSLGKFQLEGTNAQWMTRINQAR